MCDMIGLDGVNRLLSGSLNGIRPWRLGYNLVNGNTNLAATGAPPKVDGIAEDPFKMLKVLEMHTLDGVVLSNEEPHSFSTTGERDATIFNVAVQGPAPTNNGFLNYESHSGMELYTRGHDAHAFHETVPVTSERAGLTWHGKIGYDFVAAFTNHYTQFPLQMFDRHPQVLDRAYVILRRYNLWDDVIVPHAARKGVPTADVRAQLKVVDGMNDDADIDIKTFGPTRLKKMYFFQYMPCTSRAFQIYKYNKIRANGAYSSISTNLTWKEEKMDAVRDADIENCVGAWCLGKIIDPYMARAPRFSGGPVNSSYRIEVNVKVQWMPRNKQTRKDVTLLLPGPEAVYAEENTKIYKPYMYTMKDRIRNSESRYALGMLSRRSLAETELHERPMFPSASRDGTLAPGGINVIDEGDGPQLDFSKSRAPKTVADRNVAATSCASAASCSASSASSAPSAPIESILQRSQQPQEEISIQVSMPATVAATPTAAPTAAPATRSSQRQPAAVDTSVLTPTQMASTTAQAAPVGPVATTARPPTSTAASKQPSRTPASAPVRTSSMVDAAVDAAKRKSGVSEPASASATASSRAQPPRPAAAPKATPKQSSSVVDSVFDTIFGGSAPVATDASASSGDASRPGAVSPTPSSGSESAPKTFSRRNR
jgi:hypothetical protein